MDKTTATSSTPDSVLFTGKWLPDLDGNPYIEMPTPLPAGWPKMPPNTLLPGKLVTAADGSQTVIFALPASSGPATP